MYALMYAHILDSDAYAALAGRGISTLGGGVGASTYAPSPRIESAVPVIHRVGRPRSHSLAQDKCFYWRQDIHAQEGLKGYRTHGTRGASRILESE